MAHQIDLSTGKPAFFSLREKPWHGLGTVITEPVKCSDAIILGGLNYEVSLQPIITTEGNAISTHFATRREDTKAILGVVGSKYTPLQNSEAFAPFEPLVDQGIIQIETAGALRGGARMFLTCRAKGVETSVRGDQVQGYFLLANGHDGSLCLHMGFTPVRVVCSNTLAMARSNTASSLIRLKHTSSIRVATNKLIERVDWVTNQFKLTTEQYDFLASKVINRAELRQYIMQALDMAPEGPQTQNQIDDIEMIANRQTNTTAASKGTWWGAYNAIAEYLTHETGRSQESRLVSQWFGQNASTTHDALKMAVGFAQSAPAARNASPLVFDFGSLSN